MGEVLKVSRSGFYAWRKRPPSKRSQTNRQLVQEMEIIHQDRDGKNFGSPPMCRALKGRGFSVSENTVAKLMKENDLRAKSSRKFKATTNSDHDDPVAENLLGQEFEQDAPDQVWLPNVTYVWTLEGWLFLACVMDLCTRRIVGWSMDKTMTRQLVLDVPDALEMGLAQRDVGEGLLHHSDRGSQYTSGDYQARLAQANITCSMNRKGNCRDNAPMESFFASLNNQPRCLSLFRDRL